MNINRLYIICCTGLFSTFVTVAQEPLKLSLSECRKMALTNSKELQQSENNLLQAELDLEIATTAYLPKFEGSATGVYLLPDMDMMGMDLQMRGTYMAGINLTQPIYAGGKISTGRKLARIGKEAASEQHRMTRMDVLTETDKAYWTYIAVERKVRMLESYRTQMDTLYLQTSAALSADMATRNDLLRIEAKRSEIDYQLHKARNGADLCRMAVCRLIGVGFDKTIMPTDTAFAISRPDDLTPDMELRPELHLLKQQVSAGEEKIRMTRADMLPTVGLSAGYTYYGNIKLKSMVNAGNGTMIPYTQEFKDGFGIAMLAVKIPIFHWGENRKKVRKAQYELQNAQLELEKNTRLLSIEVQQAIRNLQDGYLLIHTAETGVEQANENLRVTSNRYAASMAPLTELLDAQSQWQQAQSNLIEAQTQYKIYETEYLRVTGKLE